MDEDNVDLCIRVRVDSREVETIHLLIDRPHGDELTKFEKREKSEKDSVYVVEAVWCGQALGTAG